MTEKLNNVSEMIDTAIGKSRRLKEGILKADWEKIVGKICEKCQPDYIKEGILYVRVESPVFIHHFTFEKVKYIKLINDYFGEKVIKDIVVKTGKLDENRDEYLLKIEKTDEIAEVVETLQKVEDMRNNLNIPEEENINLGILEKVAHLQKMAIEREKYLLSHGFKKCKVCGMLYEGEEEFCKVCLDNGSAKQYLKNRNLREEEEEN